MELIEIVKHCSNNEYLQKFIEIQNNFAKAKRDHANKITKLELEKEELTLHLSTLLNDKKELQKEQSILLKRIEDNNQWEKLTDVTKYFNRISEMLGYSLSDVKFKKDQRSYYVKCHYNEECYVCFEISSCGTINLLEIFPHHPNFGCIQEHLCKTQDSNGLLSHLLIYFSEMKIRQIT